MASLLIGDVRDVNDDMKGKQFYLDTIIRKRDCCKSTIEGDRIGVPGGKPYLYINTLGGLDVATVFTTVGRTFFFKVHFAWMTTMAILSSLLPVNEHTAQLHMPPYVAGILQGLSIFFLTFFVGQIFSKYNTRFENVCKTNGNVTRLSADACATLPKQEATTVLRYANSILHIYYMMLSGPMDEAKWQLLEKRGLLTAEEIQKLNMQGSPAVVLYSWAGKILNSCQNVHGMTHMSIAMEQQLGGVRGLAAKQIAYELVQVPRVYYNAILFLVNGFVFCTGIDAFGHQWFRCMHVSCAFLSENPTSWNTTAWDMQVCPMCLGSLVVGQFMIIFVFGILLTAATTMAECYGPEKFHYDLGVDLDNLWKESQNVLAAMDVELPLAVAVDEAQTKSAVRTVF